MRSSRTSRASLIRVLSAGTLLGVASVALVGVSQASASTVGGSATIVDQTIPATGGSNDLFTVQLPAGAACTGDTSTDGYHEFSYLIPQGSISQSSFATSLNFTGPPAGTPSKGLGLVEQSTGDVWEGKSTAPTTAEVIGIPADFQWAQLVTQLYYPLDGSGGLLYNNNTSGIWETGIACANSSGVISDYWNTEVTFTASATDGNGFTWSAVPGLSTWVPEAQWAVLLPVAGVAILGGGVWVSRRRRSARHAALSAGALDD
jgi:hypothetical protein